ncbi:STE like transcription factor-domain-containing protein [Mucidula mucida]|nr:STE like transcription factor-domain-containing protein [Mucidula mucida]
MDATSSSYGKLSLQPTVPHEHDPSEHTARPGNAQRHAMWLSTTQQQQDDTDTYTADSVSTPGLSKGLSRPLTAQETDRLAHLDRLKFFLATAPSGWEKNAAAGPSSYTPDPANPALNRFLLPTQEFVTCVLWNGLYHITGTDIVRALIFRFEAFGRPVRNMKKFEEGVFSDLRNLKPGVDACLEEPKVRFLSAFIAISRLAFKYQCIRTQKKQKVFYWFSVPHDRLFLDALERDLKREKMGMEPTTVITGEPAMSFTYDKKRSLYEQFTGSKSSSGRHASSRSKSSSEGELEWNVRRLEEEGMLGGPDDSSDDDAAAAAAQQSPFFSMFSLFEGSPTYKQRRKKANHGPARTNGISERKQPDDPMTGVQVKRESISAADMFIKQARGELGQPLAPSAFFDNYGQFEQTKVFVCPLLSCGRMFKRMEHLKRHLRTHTMERPFVCDKCGKKFSRSDNLGQHMRWTNQDWGDWINSDEEGEDRAPPTANIGVGLGMYGGLGIGMGMADSTGEWAASAASNVPSGADYGLNVEMCEVEIAGDLREVPGDEEGLVTEVFASDYQYAAPQGGTSGYYALHPQQWPSSAPISYGPRPMSSAGTSSSGSGSMYGDDDGAYLSMSAPSHKQVFDHASLYPSSSLDGGPVRRHRSMTPSLIRNGSGDSVGGGDRPSRGFHPYAHAGPSISSSRAGVEEQMRQMMRSDSGGSVGGGSRPGSALSLYGGGYRTDSPREESPAVYASAFHGHAHAHAATVPGGGGYAPQHVSTM